MPISGGPGIPGDTDKASWPLPGLPAVVVLDGVDMYLRPAPTLRLLGALVAGNWSAFFPGLLRRRDQWTVELRLMDAGDPLDMPEISAVGRWAAAQVAGMPWWAARTLAWTARDEWPLLVGRAALAGGDLATLPLPSVLGAAWALLREGCGDDDDLAEMRRKVFDSTPDDLTFADLASPGAADLAEAEWAAEAAKAFAGMGGFFTL